MEKVFEFGTGRKMEIIVTDHGTILIALEGDGYNERRQATGISAAEARAIAVTLNAAAEFSR